MKIKLDPEQGFITEEGKFNQQLALYNAGVKAAVCYKEPVNNEVIAPWNIRELESKDTLITRGISTIFSDHTTPTEHANVGLEIIGIPKILCMILNNEHQHTSDERSLRYTEVEPNEYITDLEVKNYRKWLNIFEQLITEKYFDFYRKFNKSDIATTRAIKKLAQENARYQVSVFMPTTLTHTIPFIQINKIATYMERIIKNPLNDLEESLVPYLKDFIKQLKDLKVLITENDVKGLLSEEGYAKLLVKYPNIEKYEGSDELLYKNNKNIDLSLFAYRNKFSGINSNNVYGAAISYNAYISWAGLAQLHRHRSINLEMQEDDEFKWFIPPIIRGNEKYETEWKNDYKSTMQYHPQGELVKINMTGSVAKFMKNVATERCCERAQLEIEDFSVNQFIPDLYQGLLDSGNSELAEEVKPYVKKLKCAFPTYKCPNPCGHPRIDRDL